MATIRLLLNSVRKRRDVQIRLTNERHANVTIDELSVTYTNVQRYSLFGCSDRQSGIMESIRLRYSLAPRD